MPKSLTARYVEAARTDGERRSFHDNKVRGLTLRVSSSNTKTWSVVYRRRADGVRRRYTIGRYPAIDLAHARAKAQEIIAAASQGADPADHAQQRRTAVTFADLVDEYVQRFAAHNKSATVLYDDNLKLAKDVLPAIGAKLPRDINKQDIIAIADKIVRRGAGVTSNRVIALIKAIFNWGIAEDLVGFNPAATVRDRVEERPRDRISATSKSGRSGLVLTMLG